MKYKLGNEIDAGGMTFVLPADAVRPMNVHNPSRLQADLEVTLIHLGAAAEVRANVMLHSRTLDAEYRQWKQTNILAALDRDPKMAQWKIISVVEASSDFLARQLARVRAETALTLVDGYVVLLQERLSTLRTIMGSDQRGEAWTR